MSYKVPVGGVFASIYYEFEDGFQVFGNPGLDDEYYLNINKMLGHGVRITRWNENNNVNLIRGLNNIEAAAATDGQYEGQLSIEFEAVGNLEWLEALMGLRTEVNGGKILEYTKKGVPRTLTFLIMIQNDADNPHGGDVFVLKGVVLQNVDISVEGQNVPVHVEMTAPYAAEVAYSSENLPDFFTTTENAFNAGQSVAYFWNPAADVNDLASFDSVETVVESFRMSISHGAELIRGIGSRLARDKYHKYLDYTVTVKSYYRDKERFLEKFYGCREGPINDLVPPLKRVLLVVQNCRSCGDAYRRYEFEFNNAKLNTRDSSIDIEDAIMETYEFKPLNAVIRAWNGEDPVPEFSIAPEHIKQGDLVAMHGKFFPRDATTTITVDGTLFASIQINCSGGFEYRFMAGTDVWTIGNHEVRAVAYTGSDVYGENLVDITQTVFVTSENVNAIPRITACPMLFSKAGDNTYENITISGYNFGTYGETSTATMAIYSGSGEKVYPTGTVYADIKSYFSGTIGSFKTAAFSFTKDCTGQLVVEVNQVLTAGGYYKTTNHIYITDISWTGSVDTSRTIEAIGFKPYERCTLYIDDDLGVLQYKGAAAADSVGAVTFVVDVNDGFKTTEIRQSVILTDGSGQLVASEEIEYSS